MRCGLVVVVLVCVQAAQQVMELQEAAQISQGLQTANVGRDTSVHDMKAIVKTWRYSILLVAWMVQYDAVYIAAVPCWQQPAQSDHGGKL